MKENLKNVVAALKQKFSLTVIQRIGGGFTILVILILLASFLSYQNLNGINAQLQEVTGKANPLVVTSNKQIINLLKLNKVLVEHVSTLQLDKFKEYEETYNQLKHNYDDVYYTLKKQATDQQVFLTKLEEQNDIATQFFESAELALRKNRSAGEKVEQVQSLALDFQIVIEEIQNHIKNVQITVFDEYVLQMASLFNDIFGLTQIQTLQAINTSDIDKIRRISADNQLRSEDTQNLYNDFIEEAPERKEVFDPLIEKYLRHIAHEGGVLEQYKTQMELVTEAKMALADATVHVNTAIDVLQELVGIATSFATRANEKADQTLELGIAATLSTTVISFLLAAGIGLWVSRSIKKPLDAIVKMLKKVADGDMTQRITISSRDELGMLSGWVNDLARKLQDTMKELSNGSKQLAQAADDALKISEKSSDSIVQQKDETTAVATAMTEMDASVQEVSLSANRTLEEIVKADQATQASMNIVTENVTIIHQLARKIEQSAEVIHRLDEYSGKIGTVLDVIRGVAEQTNLLALNAAIEAARAGEQGRGFAVVADEVRTLASRTQASTKEIHTMIDNLQNGTAEAVNVMEQSSAEMQRSVSQADQASESLKNIQDVMLVIRDMSTQIASSAEQQHVVTHDIAENINRISYIAEQNAERISEIAMNSQMLDSLADRQNKLINTFKVD